MHPAGWGLVAALAGAPAGGPDAGVARDARPPAWVPQSKRVDLAEEAYYGLRRQGDGYVYEGPQFVARVARDGVVTFQDRRLSVHDLWPISSVGKSAAGRPGPTLESTLRDYLGKRRRPPPESPVEPAPLPPGIDWNAVCPPHSSCDMRMLPMLVQVSGSFDLTDEIMRARGRDPYAREKAKFLSATFEFRIRMAMAARQEDMATALAHLPEYLEGLWRDERYSPRERRRILYELWYETDPGAEGQRAARAIDAFIRRRLPCGSPAGYSSAELRQFAVLHPERPFPIARDCAAAPPRSAPSTSPAGEPRRPR
jgi:hypothetical protein